MDTKSGYSAISQHPTFGSGIPASDCPVRTALHRNSLRGLARVTCELREGMAILHGKVSTFYLKQLAQEVVKKVDGVECVVNRVNVCHT